MRARTLVIPLLYGAAHLFAASVKDDQTILRSGCTADTTAISTLAAGTPVTLKFALSGEKVPCYKVGVDVDGKLVNGYLPASALEGLDSFDDNRKSAAWIEVRPSANQTTSHVGATSADTSSLIRAAQAIRIRATPAAVHAKELIDQGRTEEALNIVDSEGKRHPDAGLFAMAGVTAIQADQNRRALDYLKASLDLEANSSVDTIYKQLLREVNADQSITKLYGVNVVLRFDGNAIPIETARQMLGTVDEALLRVSEQLGCRTDEKIITIAQTWDSYKQARGAVEWSAGMFDGRIRVPMERDKPLSSESRKTLAHEATHACLSMFGHLPQWLHEGLAQKLSGETLSPYALKKMAELAHAGKLAPLEQLGNGWGGLTAEQARYAYAEALIAVNLLMKDFGNDGVRNLLRNPERIPTISAELDKRLAE
jgi:hypothetical protein